jgi:protocatechuate 3,4-dioxygenase beta subunit
MKFDRPISDRATPSRRTILKASAALLAAGILSPISSALAQMALRRTQDQILGPFYPIMSKPNRSGDLRRYPEARAVQRASFLLSGAG